MNKSLKPLAVIILAAGKGTRMDSDLPKVLHPIGNLPMITRVVQTANELGADRIIPVLGYKHELVQSALKDEPVECVLQLQQFGTAHAVLQCHDTLENLLSVHDDQGALGTILTADLSDPTGYGRVIRGENGDLSKIVEEKDATDEERAVKEINTGIYVFKSWTLFNLLPMVGNNNSQKEYYLPDVLNLILEKNDKVAIEKINNYFEIQGVNNPEQLSEMNEYHEKTSIHI